ncbi:PEBP-like protein [Coprinopsis sp. MPI-PUGE-AT-0042]|nr:PEBP-like protein [Coprinopsis sp. MPI-PUGE-AT-0042]KAH6919290.1 PEBP-like protein [Coprinopsis sp. MPI-PUGE-AT-0042]
MRSFVAVASILSALSLVPVEAQTQDFAAQCMQAGFHDARIPEDMAFNYNPTAYMQAIYPQSSGNAMSFFPGMQIPQHATGERPSFQVHQASETGPFVIAIVDPDAPYPSAPSDGQYRHFLGSDYFIGDNGFDLTTNTDPISDYQAPSPPGDSDAHRYVFLMYRQPDNFHDQTFVTSDTPRTGWNVSDFAYNVNMGDPIGASWMLVAPESTN